MATKNTKNAKSTKNVKSSQVKKAVVDSDTDVDMELTDHTSSYMYPLNDLYYDSDRDDTIVTDHIEDNNMGDCSSQLYNSD